MEERKVVKDEKGVKVLEAIKPKDIRRPDTLRYIEKKLEDKGIHRMERHPSDGLAVSQPPRKSGHGGKFTWEGPADTAESELDPVPPAIDPKDPNYVDDDNDNDEEGMKSKVIIGEVEVAKVAEAKDGVSRIEVLPPVL